MPQSKERHTEYMRQRRTEKKLERQLEKQHKQLENPQPKPKTKAQAVGMSYRVKRKLLIPFVRFDLFHPSSRDECLKIRLARLGLSYDDEDNFNEHLELCEGCKAWWDNLNDNNLDSKDEQHLYLAYARDFASPEEMEDAIKKVNGKIISIDKRLKKVTLIGDEISSFPLSNIDLGKFDLFPIEPKENSSSISEDVRYQQELTRQNESQPEQQGEQQQPQQPRKNYNPSYEEWSQSHSS